ncbi:NADPH:quinone reductase [Leptolyngbya sp. NIES-2104]|uniref:NADPH:quinone reductase n=1 Tax=Leptolyngbya sp. NIES-2104 TaxID=1552121 RepID=UPI0006ECAA28|nr:NADPH:quinone reductase [Leptolyngbya sp. NIES-2104]GAP97987.1 quinone oxidoreductase [Leptolyngbya sp. NIES-2104]
MKAIQVSQFGSPDVLQLVELPDLTPAAGQVVMQVHAAGVSPLDTYVREQSHGAPTPPLPYIPGFEAAGTIAALGEGVTQFQVGDQVYANTFLGAYAEQVVLDATTVYRSPNTVSFAQATMLSNSYPTAYYALYHLAKAKPGETVFVHGASGAVGTAAVQMARAGGLKVVGTAGSDRGLELIKSEGAHYALNHRDPDYLKQALAITDGQGFDIILEMNATKKLADDAMLVGKFGRIVVIGGTNGAAPFDATPILWKGASIIGLYIGLATLAELAQIHAAIYAGLENKTLRPTVAQEFSLVDAAKAHEAVHQNSSSGKIVLSF